MLKVLIKSLEKNLESMPEAGKPWTLFSNKIGEEPEMKTDNFVKE